MVALGRRRAPCTAVSGQVDDLDRLVPGGATTGQALEQAGASRPGTGRRCPRRPRSAEPRWRPPPGRRPTAPASGAAGRASGPGSSRRPSAPGRSQPARPDQALRAVAHVEPQGPRPAMRREGPAATDRDVEGRPAARPPLAAPGSRPRSDRRGSGQGTGGSGGGPRGAPSGHRDRHRGRPGPERRRRHRRSARWPRAGSGRRRRCAAPAGPRRASAVGGLRRLTRPAGTSRAPRSPGPRAGPRAPDRRHASRRRRRSCPRAPCRSGRSARSRPGGAA